MPKNPTNDKRSKPITAAIAVGTSKDIFSIAKEIRSLPGATSTPVIRLLPDDPGEFLNIINDSTPPALASSDTDPIVYLEEEFVDKSATDTEGNELTIPVLAKPIQADFWFMFGPKGIEKQSDLDAYIQQALNFALILEHNPKHIVLCKKHKDIAELITTLDASFTFDQGKIKSQAKTNLIADWETFISMEATDTITNREDQEMLSASRGGMLLDEAVPQRAAASFKLNMIAESFTKPQQKRTKRNHDPEGNDFPIQGPSVIASVGARAKKLYLFTSLPEHDLFRNYPQLSDTLTNATLLAAHYDNKEVREFELILKPAYENDQLKDDTTIYIFDSEIPESVKLVGNLVANLSTFEEGYAKILTETLQERLQSTGSTSRGSSGSLPLAPSPTSAKKRSEKDDEDEETTTGKKSDSFNKISAHAGNKYHQGRPSIDPVTNLLIHSESFDNSFFSKLSLLPGMDRTRCLVRSASDRGLSNNEVRKIIAKALDNVRELYENDILSMREYIPKSTSTSTVDVKSNIVSSGASWDAVNHHYYSLMKYLFVCRQFLMDEDIHNGFATCVQRYDEASDKTSGATTVLQGLESLLHESGKDLHPSALTKGQEDTKKSGSGFASAFAKKKDAIPPPPPPPPPGEKRHNDSRNRDLPMPSMTCQHCYSAIRDFMNTNGIRGIKEALKRQGCPASHEHDPSKCPQLMNHGDQEPAKTKFEDNIKQSNNSYQHRVASWTAKMKGK